MLIEKKWLRARLQTACRPGAWERGIMRKK
jgi:hypothetical protein